MLKCEIFSDISLLSSDFRISAIIYDFLITLMVDLMNAFVVKLCEWAWNSFDGVLVFMEFGIKMMVNYWIEC